MFQYHTLAKVLESCYGLGLMFGPPLGGILYSLTGFYLPFWFSGVGFTIHQIPKKNIDFLKVDTEIFHPGPLVLVRLHIDPFVGSREGDAGGGGSSSCLGETFQGALVQDSLLPPHHPQPCLPCLHLCLLVLVLAIPPTVPLGQVQLF